MIALSIIIKGRVQGVHYRRFAKQLADRLGLKGWIRNLENGDVEVLVQGARYKLEIFSEGLRKGPPNSRIDSIEIKKVKEDDFSGFSIIEQT